MAVTEQNPRNISTAAAGATVFPYDFKILDKADLLVQIDGVVKVVDVDFTITGVGLDGGGSFTLVSPLVGGETVMRKRNMRLERLNDWQSLGDLRSQTLNNDQDAPVMMLQQVAEEVGRSLRLGQGVAGVSTEIGNPAPLSPLVWNADGTQLVAGSPLGTGDMLLRGDLAAGVSGKGAELVAFKQSADGSVQRTALEKLREVVTSSDFGAVGDGITDDRQAIVSALAAASEVRMLEGDYLITGAPITIPAGKRIIGGGGLISSASTTPVRFLRAGGDNYSFFVLEAGAELRNVWLGPADEVAPSSGRCVDIQASGCVVSDIIIEKCWDGIYLKDVAGAYFQRAHVGGWQNAGFNLDGNNSDVFLTESIINGATAPGTGLRLHNKVEAFVMTSCDVIGGGLGLTTSASGAMTPTARLNPNFNKISDCYFDSSVGGVSIDKSSFLTFTACWFASSQLGPGVNVQEAWETTFQGCEFFSNYGNGATLQSTQRGTRFIGCRFINNNVSATGASGLLVNDNTTDWSLVGCTFNNLVYPAGPLQKYGLFIGTGVDRFQVTSCNFGAHPTAKVNDNSAPSADKYFAFNTGYRTANSFQTTAPSGATSHLANHDLGVTPNLSDVVVIPNQDPGTRYWVGSVSATQIGIGFQSALGSAVSFTVSVRSKGS